LLCVNKAKFMAMYMLWMGVRSLWQGRYPQAVTL
jgi:hypothetical protein